MIEVKKLREKNEELRNLNDATNLEISMMHKPEGKKRLMK
jgi:hypothetical protein